jgi:hypothetical protein
MVQRCGVDTYEGELRGRVGEERGGKETNRCPLTACRKELYTGDISPYLYLISSTLSY